MVDLLPVHQSATRWAAVMKALYNISFIIFIKSATTRTKGVVNPSPVPHRGNVGGGSLFDALNGMVNAKLYSGGKSVIGVHIHLREPFKHGFSLYVLFRSCYLRFNSSAIRSNSSRILRSSSFPLISLNRRRNRRIKQIICKASFIVSILLPP